MTEKDYANCRKCGDCCTYFGMAFQLKPEDPMFELLKAHYGREITKVQFRVHHVCDQLVRTEKDELRCAIYEERPEICRNFICKFADNRSDVMMFQVNL